MDDIEKKYFTISEVSDLLDIAPSVIRFWESQFKTLKPRKNKNGVRQYTSDDIEKLKAIHFLVKKKGYTLQGAKEVLQKQTIDNPSGTGDDLVKMIEELEGIKSFLLDLKQVLQAKS
jgi:DNA-binding transcriptional MerR regulator